MVCNARVTPNKTTRTRPDPRDIVHSSGTPTDQTRDLEGITSWQKGVGPHSLWIERFFSLFFLFSFFFFSLPTGMVSLALLALASSPGELVYHFDGLDFCTRSFSFHMCTQPGFSAHTLLQRLLPHRWTEEKEDRFAILHNFLAKCRYICTRNVSWCQVHSSHIHASHKTKLHYSSSKHQNKKSLLNLEVRVRVTLVVQEQFFFFFFFLIFVVREWQENDITTVENLETFRLKPKGVNVRRDSTQILFLLNRAYLNWYNKKKLL